MEAGQNSVVSARGLTLRYRETRALDGVDLDIPRGQVTALLGPNGAGKTSFITCALGLTRPSNGTLTVLGGVPGARAVRRRLGVMLQDADLLAMLTPREHLSLFASYYPAPMAVDEAVSLSGINDFADKAYGRLSGGQKRRVQFALALIGRPDLIFLDEPTTGLDVEARRILWRNIRYMTDMGAGILLTTHYLEEADSLADRIVVMSEGRVVAEGATDDMRAAIGGAMIRCMTVLPPDALAGLPMVKGVRQTGRWSELLTGDATATLKALIEADPQVSEIGVRKPSLEEAFLDLTGGDH